MSLVKNWVFEFKFFLHFDHNACFWDWSQFKLLSFLTIWVFVIGHNLHFWVWSQYVIFDLITIRVFVFGHSLRLLSFVTIGDWVFFKKNHHKKWHCKSKKKKSIADKTGIAAQKKAGAHGYTINHFSISSYILKF